MMTYGLATVGVMIIVQFKNNLKMKQVKKEWSEDQIAYKFVEWDVRPLESYKNSVPYQLRLMILNKEKLSEGHKNYITTGVTNARTHGFQRSVVLGGYAYDFSEVLHPYFVSLDGGKWDNWQVYYATSAKSLARILHTSDHNVIRKRSQFNDLVPPKRK